jgi:hypothetical protein
MKIINYLIFSFLSLFIIFGCELNSELEPVNYEPMVRAYAESFDDASFSENSEDTVILYATVWPKTSQPVSVNFSFSGTATEGTDYEVLTTGQVTIDPSDTTGLAEIRLVILNDLEAEDSEDIIMTLSDPNGAALDETNNSRRVIIEASDNPVDVEFDNSQETFLENEDAKVKVELSESLETDLTVNYSTSDLTTNPGDYTVSGTLVIPAGKSSGDIAISLPPGDIEYDETFWLILKSVVGNGKVGDADSVLVTIQDNSINPPGDDIAFVIAWDTLSTADLELTLWEDTGSDTVEIVTSNNPASFESVILEDALGDGTYLVTATWLSGSATEVDYIVYTASNGFDQGNRKDGTIDMKNEPIFLYTITKETSTDTGID